MNYQNITRDDLIIKLQTLQHEYDLLKESYEKNSSDRKKSEDLYRTVISNAPISIFATDDKGIFILNEGKALENAGMKPGENVGVSGYDLFSNLKVVETSGKIIDGMSVLDRVLKGEFLSGITELNNVIFYNSFTPMIDENNRISGMIGVATDVTENTKAIKALKESEEKYRLLFENSGEAILFTNPDGSIYSANPEACRIFGMTKEEISGGGRDYLIDNEDPRLEKALEERSRTGRFKGELNFIRKGKTKFPAEVASNVFIDSAGEKRTSMIIRDISERKLAEEKLRNSEVEYRNLFENSMMAISQVHLKGNILKINKAYANMYGYPDTTTMLNEISENTKILYSNPDDRKRVLDGLEENDTLSPVEFELVRRNGEKFWALVGVRKVRDNTGKPLYLQAEHIDITSQKRVEHERYLTSLYARNLLEASLDPLVTINKSGKITDVNKSTIEITGINRNKIIGTDFADYFTEPAKARKGYKLVFSKGVVKDYPLTIRHTSGREIDVLYNATLYKNEAGDVQGVFAAARDITEQKKMEGELRNSKDLLEKLNQHLLKVRENERSQIALNLHDDFGQRLTALNLDLAWLKSRMGVQSVFVKKKLQEMSLMINESIDSIREISSFLRPAILYELGLVPAFEWQLEKFKKQSGINFIFNFRPEKIKIDDQISLILFRILQESLTNIIRHSHATEVELDLRMTKMNIKLRIRDNGKGIKDEEIFSLSSMGITGIFERIRSVNGQVSIDGFKNKGTVLNVTIPLTKHKAK